MTGAWESRRPPRWLPRALAMAVVAVFVGIFAWRAAGQLRGLAVDVLIAFFITLVLEPFVLWLVRHGWRRPLAAVAGIVGSLLLAVALVALFGNLFVQQFLEFLDEVPNIYASLQSWLSDRFGVTLPGGDEVVRDTVTHWGSDIASGVLVAGTTVISAIFSAGTILIVAYYLSAAGPRLRVAVCRWLTPDRQSDVLLLWETAQRKVADFVRTRIVLAALCAAFTFGFLTLVGTPYALPLGVFTGVVSQFVPTIGTYLGGALPVVVALTAQGTWTAVAVLVFIVLYQQVENTIFSPRITGRVLEMNPAVSFLVVMGFGAVFGALGAFLALPVAATVQAVASTYFERHELIESHMLRDPQRTPRAPHQPQPE